MADDIVVRYRADVDEALKKLDAFAKENEQLATSSTKAAKGIEQTAKATDRLEKEITDTGKKVKEANKSITDFGKQGDDTFKKLGGSIKSFAAGAAAALGVAFSVDAIIQFGKASIDAFLEAEKNAERLKFAITTIGGESEAAFDRLIRQSSRMQEITVFSDDSIQQAQAALSAFGLTADEIERTIPLLADYATVTGQDVVSAVQQIGAGLEGAGREFKKYGIEVSATASRQDNLNNMLDGFGKFAGAAEEATKTLSGQLGQLNNRADELQETIGSKLAAGWVKAKIALFDFVNTILTTQADIDKASADRRASNERDLVIAELEGRAKINALTIQENAEKRLAEIEREKIAIRQQMIKSLQADDKAEDARLVQKDQRAKREIDILNEIIQIEKDRARIAKERATEEVTSAAIAATKKANEERLKEYERLRKAIEDGEAELTQMELTEIEKRDAAFLKSMDKRLKALDEMRKRAEQAQSILTEQTLSGLDGAPLSERIAFADTFEKETLADTEKEKARLAISVEDYEDYTNQVVILEKQAADKITAVKERLGVTSQQLHDLDIKALQYAMDIAREYANLIGEIASTFAQYSQGKIEEINRVKEEELKAIDESLAANDEALSKRRISEKSAEENKKKLLEARVRAEEEAAKKERAIKRKQFNLDKAASVAQISINIAEAITKALTAGPIAGQILAGLTAVLGAVQLGLALSQPNPYRKGTKGAKQGLALVGEEGPELTYMPRGAKVLPANKTDKYGDMIDAMYDGRLQDYINKQYIAPALRKEKARRETTFADNVARSAMMQTDSSIPGLTYYDMEALRKKGTRLTDDTIDRLADAITRRSSHSDPYRR